ncbi:MAG: FlaD/FlaE family flagellar protein [Halobacteriales archaeon]
MEFLLSILGSPVLDSGILGLPSWIAISGAGMAIAGILDFLGDDDGDNGGDDSMEGEMMFDDDDEMGDDLGGELDDDLGMEDLDDGGDDFDEVDMDMGDGAGSSGELENRVDELENELADLSSTVSTVRSENEEISETVNETEENVRKLLDIYEMVTKGVNPFVDEAQMGAGGGGMGGGSFDVFDTGGDDGNSDEEEELDSSIADADAESFFDEEMMEPDADEALDDSFDMEGEADNTTSTPSDASNDLFDDSDEAFGGSDAEPSSDSGDDSGGGKSFDELKAEYESGEADWADEESPDAEPTNVGNGEDSDDEDALEETFDAEEETDFGKDDGDNDPSSGKNVTVNEGIDALDEVDQDDDDDPSLEKPGGPSRSADAADSVADQEEIPEDDADSFEFVDDPESGSPKEDIETTTRPYLNDLPSGYHADLIVLEWLEYLLMESSMREAMESVRYYEDIEWISADVGDHLQETLLGLDGYTRVEADGGTPGGLTMEHHAESLRYISRLSASTPGTAVLNNWLEHGHGPGGGSNGF